MIKSYGNGDDRLGLYCSNLFNPMKEIHQKVIAHCKANSLPPIWINEMDAKHLELFAVMATQSNTQSAKILEIGTLGGFSAICMGLVTHENTKIYSLELNPKTAKVARENIEAANLSHRIEVIQGNALQTLSELESEGPFELVFIDADKSSYLTYGQWAFKNLKIGGVLVADNTFAWGLVLQKNIDDPDKAIAAEGVKKLNEFVAKHRCFVSTLFPTGEGLTVAVKISA